MLILEAIKNIRYMLGYISDDSRVTRQVAKYDNTDDPMPTFIYTVFFR